MTQDDTEFCRAELKDVPQLAIMEGKYIECPWSEAVLAQTLSDELSRIELLLRDGRIIGYGGFKMALDTAEIYNIVVDERHRRCGYGTRIVQRVLDLAVESGAKEIFLEVNERNAPAIALYTGCGFEIVTMRKNYYKSGGALLMKRTL